VVDNENGEISEITRGTHSFDRLQRSVTNFHASILVEFDWTYGYPKSMALDTARNLLADDEISFDFLDFIPRRYSPPNKTPSTAPWPFGSFKPWIVTPHGFCLPDFRAALLFQVEKGRERGKLFCQSRWQRMYQVLKVHIFDIIQEAVNLTAATVGLM
jgi:hypothetical protein